MGGKHIRQFRRAVAKILPWAKLYDGHFSYIPSCKLPFSRLEIKNVVIPMAVKSIPLAYFLSAIMGPLCLLKFLLFISRSLGGCLTCAHKHSPTVWWWPFPSCDPLPSWGGCFQALCCAQGRCAVAGASFPAMAQTSGEAEDLSCMAPGWATAQASEPLLPAQKGVSSPHLNKAGYLWSHNNKMCCISSQNCAEVWGKGLPADFLFAKNISLPTRWLWDTFPSLHLSL